MIVLSSPFSSYLGKMSGIATKRMVSKVFFGSSQVIFANTDKGLNVLKKSLKARKKVVCIWKQNGNFAIIIAVLVDPKGQLLQSLKKDLNSFGRGDISLGEALELYTPKYQNPL